MDTLAAIQQSGRQGESRFPNFQQPSRRRHYYNPCMPPKGTSCRFPGDRHNTIKSRGHPFVGKHRIFPRITIGRKFRCWPSLIRRSPGSACITFPCFKISERSSGSVKSFNSFNQSSFISHNVYTETTKICFVGCVLQDIKLPNLPENVRLVVVPPC